MATITPEQLANQLEAAGPRLAAELKRRTIGIALRMEARGKANATGSPRVRTGTLRRSIAGTVAGGTSRPLEAIVSAGGRQGGADVPYARAQDQGAIIRPRSAQWLAIPASSVRTGAGVPRFASPRMYPGDLWFMPIRSGLAALVETVGGRPQARWWLKKQVEVPATRYLERAWRETAVEVPQTLSGALEAAMRPQVGA